MDIEEGSDEVNPGELPSRDDEESDDDPVLAEFTDESESDPEEDLLDFSSASRRDLSSCSSLSFPDCLPYSRTMIRVKNITDG